MRKTNLERLREKKRSEQTKFETDLAGLFRLMLGDDPNPTQWAAVCDPERVVAYMGPAGCAKTSTLAAVGLGRALLQPGSKGLVARYDYNDLKDTTALRFEEMVNRLPKGVLIDRDKQAPMKWWIHPAMGGEPSQITFMGLKETVGSYEFNWEIVDEADECEEGRIMELDTRLRAAGGNYKLMLAFNPPPKNHWLYTACTGRDFQERVIRDPWMKLYRPIPNENQAHLPADYYQQLAKGKPEEMIQRLVHGEWGSTFAGQPVYREFKYSFHVRRSLEFSPHEPLLRFWDFGFNRPACIWAQLTWDGRLLFLREEMGNEEEATVFARRCKGITAVDFPGSKRVVDYGDPAVRQRKDTGQTLAEFAKEGITIHYVVMEVEPGLRLVRRLLGATVNGGEPVLQFDSRCRTLIDSMKGGYHMDDKGMKPKKDGFYDHLADAMRYGVTNVLGGGGYYANDSLPSNLSYDRNQDPHYLARN